MGAAHVREDLPDFARSSYRDSACKLTVDAYGKWLPMGNKAAVDRLDDAVAGESGSNADPGGGGSGGTSRKIW